MRRVILGVALSIVGMSMLLKTVAGLVIHLFTVYVAFKVSGLIAAAVTFVFPGLAEIFWAGRIWFETGNFFNLLVLALLAYLALWVMIILSASVAAAAED